MVVDIIVFLCCYICSYCFVVLLYLFKLYVIYFFCLQKNYIDFFGLILCIYFVVVFIIVLFFIFFCGLMCGVDYYEVGEIYEKFIKFYVYSIKYI